jgi:hypothetical protein
MRADAALLPAHNFLGNNSCKEKEVLLHTTVGSVLCNFLYLPTWNILYAFKCSAGKPLSNLHTAFDIVVTIWHYQYMMSHKNFW